MPEYLHPDVFPEEVPSQTQTIEGVGTTTGSFLGITEKGPIDVPTLVTGWSEFVQIFGNTIAPAGFMHPVGYLWYSVKNFFENGGKRCYITRLTHRSSGSLTAVKGVKTFNDTQSSPILALTASARYYGTWGNKIKVGFRHNPKCSTTLAAAALSTDTSISVVSTFGLKPGSELKLEGSTGTKRYVRVLSVVPGNPGTVNLTAAVGGSGVAIAGTVLSEEFDVFVYFNDEVKESWKQVSMWPSYNNINNSDFIESKMNDESFGSSYVTVVVNTANTAIYLKHPAQTLTGAGAVSPTALAAGDDGLASFVDADVIGDASIPSGLQALLPVDEISMLAAPGFTGAAVTDALRTFAANRMDVFVNVCVPKGSTVATAQTYRQNTPGLDSNRVAIYYPWGIVNDPMGVGLNANITVPPEGAVMGVDARTDIARGVYKTGAGSEAVMRGWLDVERFISPGQQDILNPIGVNCIIVKRGRGIIINGGRTCSSLPEYRYKAVVRTLIFLEESIADSIDWAVWEPNDERLWERIRLSVSAFLLERFREGFFQGTKPSEAFYVKVDATNNTQALQNEGKCLVEVGLAIVQPAEFVIIRFSQWDGGRLVQELGLSS